MKIFKSTKLPSLFMNPNINYLTLKSTHMYVKTPQKTKP